MTSTITTPSEHSPRNAFIAEYGGYGAARHREAHGILRPVIVPEEMLGQSAPCDLFNARRILLVRAGAPITESLAINTFSRQPAQQIRVFCRGTQADLISDFNPIEEMLEIGRILSHLDERIVRNEHVSADEFVRLACDLHNIWRLDADACLGYARLRKFGRPSICHAVHVALIAAELAAINGQDRFQIINVMGGALTMNLARLTLHDEMHDSTARPDERQTHEIHAHPGAGVSLLEHIGRFSKPWVDAVGAHHENIDGSGYPWSLKGSGIPLSARIVRVADTFAARITWRKSRQPLHWSLRRTANTTGFARHIFGNDLERLDQPLTTQLARALGRFPPGSLVRINNGELAIITRRIPGAMGAINAMGAKSVMGTAGEPGEAYSIRDIYGHLFTEPRYRAIGDGAYEIRNYASEECQRFMLYDWQRLWGYTEQ